MKRTCTSIICDNPFKEKNKENFYTHFRNGKHIWRSTCKRCDLIDFKYKRRINPDQKQLIEKKSKMKNAGKIKAYNDEYRKKPKWIEVRRNSAWRSAKIKNSNGEFFNYQDFLNLYALQNKRCAICFLDLIEKKAHVDHDHKTGIVRGILCVRCNMGIGSLKEEKRIFLKAMEYLKF